MVVLGLVSAALGLAPALRGALLPPTEAASTTNSTLQNILGHRAHSWTVCSTNSTETEQGIETDGASPITGDADRHLAYSNPLWPNGLDWMRLPPGTHLLLYGRSSIAGISSALRAGAEAYGVLERSVTVSAARDCADPTEDPRKHPQVTTCLYDCEAYMTVGPLALNVSTTADPHSVTHDHDDLQPRADAAARVAPRRVARDGRAAQRHGQLHARRLHGPAAAVVVRPAVRRLVRRAEGEREATTAAGAARQQRVEHDRGGLPALGRRRLPAAAPALPRGGAVGGAAAGGGAAAAAALLARHPLRARR
eukprot:scaffold4296_cov54-Phaeocystis_antarctica.AAC.1